jgi:hypothetical protein
MAPILDRHPRKGPTVRSYIEPKTKGCAVIQRETLRPGCRVSNSKNFPAQWILKGDKNMTLADGEEPIPAMSPEASEDMEKYGITRVPVDFFHYGGFRYTNLEDAVAEAIRDQRSS